MKTEMTARFDEERRVMEGVDFRDLRQALQKTKKRVEDQIKKNFGFRKGKKKDGSLEEYSGTCK